MPSKLFRFKVFGEEDFPPICDVEYHFDLIIMNYNDNNIESSYSGISTCINEKCNRDCSPSSKWIQKFNLFLREDEVEAYKKEVKNDLRTFFIESFFERKLKKLCNSDFYVVVY